MSIDIADVDVGKNIGAELQTCKPRPTAASPKPKPPNANTRRRPPSRNKRPKRSDARQSRRGRSGIPQAIAEAFRSGNLGVMDYYRLNNIKADTEMRASIGASTEAATDAQQPPPLTGPANK